MTPIREAIPPRVKKGDFAIRDGRRNPKATTIGSCATKRPKFFATTRKGNYAKG